MTPEQNELVAKYLPNVEKWARKFDKDDEYISIAHTALVEAVLHKCEGCSFQTCLWRRVHSAFRNEARYKRRRISPTRVHELLGGKRDEQVMNYFTEIMQAPEEAARLFDLIPDHLMTFSRMFLVEKLPMRAIESLVGLPRKRVQQMREDVLRILLGASDAHCHNCPPAVVPRLVR